VCEVCTVHVRVYECTARASRSSQWSPSRRRGRREALSTSVECGAPPRHRIKDLRGRTNAAELEDSATTCNAIAPCQLRGEAERSKRMSEQQ
jgi:hypothetical protein